jgi:hypothetical protein
MDNLILNVDEYNDNELEKILNLNNKYTLKDIEINSKKLKLNIENINITNQKKLEINFFIDTACSRLKNRCLQNNYDNNLNNNIIINGSHVIQENVNSILGKKSRITEGRVAGEPEYNPGYINPINVRTISCVMNIDTRFRDNYYKTKSTDFVVHLPEVQRKVVSIRISSIEMPMSFYAVKRENNNSTFIIRESIETPAPPTSYLSLENLNDNTSNRTITLTQKYKAWLVVLEDGNYELDWQKKSKSSSLVTSMNNAISNAIPGAIDQNGRFGAYITGGTSLIPSKDIAFNVDRVSGRSILALPSTTTGSEFSGKTFTIDFAVDYAGNSNLSENIQIHLGWKLGFRAGQYSNALSIISEGLCLVSGPKYAYICIDDGQKSSGTTFLAAYSNSVLDKNIISRINLSSAFDRVGAYKSGSDGGLSIQLNRDREYFGPVNISRLHIKILDEFGRILDLNNMDWSMSIIFNILYD